LVTVQFPGPVELSRVVPTPEAPDMAANGAWYPTVSCDDACTLTVRSSGAPLTTTLESTGWSAWSRDHSRYAVVGTLEGHSVLLIVQGDAPAIDTLFDSASSAVDAFAWWRDELVVAITDASGTRLQRLALDGTLADIAALPGRVNYFYPSPDESRFLFTQRSPDGWRLWIYDAAPGALSDLGNMGSDHAGAHTPDDVAPENGKGGPMYIAWAHDNAKVAFGGGFEPPYIMTTVDLGTGTHVVTELPNGYPGEIQWNTDDSLVAVSSYDIERTHHETWVVDPGTGIGTHLMNGCVIVWSPDGRFLAVHGEDVAGVAIVDVRTGERGQLTHLGDDAPLRWEP
jgi:hypothetical protein